MELQNEIARIFFDKSGRPKITPRHESAIQVKMEENFSPTNVRTALQNLERNQILVSRRKIIENVGTAKFYFLKKFDTDNMKKKIEEKIANYAYWIGRYSNNKVTKMIGDHLHDVVKLEIRAQGFEIIDEKNVKEFAGKKWSGNESLDLTARHKTKKIAIGVEIKNMLYPPPKSEVSTKIEMCKYFGIIPVFASRWMEIHRDEITKNGGFLWQFKNQLYPRGQEEFVKTIKKRFLLPVEVNSSLPTVSIKEFENWISKQDGVEN